MNAKIHKTIALSEIAAFVNNRNRDAEILAFELGPVPADIKNMSIRVEALMLILCTRGSYKMSIDLNEYDLSENSVVNINPHNYVSVYDCSDDFTAVTLVCSIKIVESILPKLSDLLPVIVFNRRSPLLSLSPEQSAWMRDAIGLIASKLVIEKTRFMLQKLESIIQALLYEVLDIYLETSKTPKAMSSRKGELMARFILAVAEDCSRHRKVEYYADKLCITSKHLSAVVKDISGVTAGVIIDRYVVLEAKILLKNTDLTIQEISTRLNFPNQSFFGKYFKHATGLAPTEYRAQFFAE